MTTISYRPRDGAVMGRLDDTTPAELDAVVAGASAASASLAATAPAQRRAWLHAIADAVDADADDLARLADDETALGLPRLTGEAARMSAQLRFYADVAAEGSYLGVAIDSTGHGAGLVRIHRPLGPVAVFGASNFPFAFGSLGNDTASALAAGCPVVVKAHPAHPRLAERLASLAVGALAEAGAPDGMLQSVRGLSTGVALVEADAVEAVAFTGSQAGGTALWQTANARPRPIPVFAEMGTVNPVVMTNAAAARVADIAPGFTASFTQGAGQFCTKPGLLFAPSGHAVAAAVGTALSAAALAPTMLTGATARGVRAGVAALEASGATVVAQTGGEGAGWSAPAVLLQAPLAAVVQGSALLDECFGAVAVVVEYSDHVELDRALDALQPSLAASVFSGGPDDPEAAALIARLSARAGRVTHDEWPTGVAWTWAQHHGGPWPATSAPAHTSVGAAALARFVVPVAFQGVAEGWLPAGVREAVASDNPWGIPRRIDGVVRTP